MHAYLDKFALYGRCIVVEGWANDYDIKLFYDDVLVPTICQVRKREDLVPHFGPNAAQWGFICCGLLNVDASSINRTAFRIDYGNGISEINPQDKYRLPSDKLFEEMVSRFQSSIASSDGSLLEIGSRARSGNVYREWFPGAKKYVGFDVAPGENVDVVGDAHHLSRHIAEKFDHIFSIAVFEHLYMPWKVAIEMNRVMNIGGTALTISHFAWPLHEEPWDFWRYSKEAWGALFNKYSGFKLVDSAYQYPSAIVPYYAADEHTKIMSQSPAYLLSGCLVEKVSAPQVWWDVEASDLLDLDYSHR